MRDVDGHDVAAVDRAIAEAVAIDDRPSLVCCRTIIGKGSPGKSGSAEAHGAALGEKEIAATRAALGWTAPAVRDPARGVRRLRRATAPARRCARAGTNASPPTARRIRTLAREFERRIAGALPAGFDAQARAFAAAQSAKAETVATRKASQQAIEAYAKALPEMIGGSADLTGSVFTNWSGSVAIARDKPGNYVNYGVREFAMTAIANGLALHGGFLPYHGTFLTFSDYARNAVRMAALMKLRAVIVYTHDSIGLGEDGPDAPVGRARREPAPHPEPRPVAALRRDRDRARLGGRHRARATGRPR